MWIVFGMVDFSRAFFTQLNVSNMAREGARKAAICQNINKVKTAVAGSAILTEPTVAWSPSTPTAVVNKPIGVTVSASFSPVTPLVGPIIGNRSLSSTAHMTVEVANSSC